MAVEVSTERRGRLAIVRLERPNALNALTPTMIWAIEQEIRAAERDPAVFAIAVTGAGRGFCAGVDMSVLADHAAGNAPASRRERPALFSFILEISKPVIAAINGPCAGGGFVLAMMCDLRFMATEASLTTVFSKRGLIAEHGTSWLLPRMIGLNRALDLLWSSRRVDAEEAYRLGFADRVVPGDELLGAVEGYVNAMADSVSPRAIAVIKRQLHDHLATDFDTAARESDALMKTALAHPDATEGARTFVERRQPAFAPWTGETI